MSRVSAVARIPGGRRAKWFVLAFWLIVVGLAGPLAGKLMGVEKNDASSWLPAKAESTKVLDLQSRFVSPNVFSAVVVYDRASGLTAADRAKAAADMRSFRNQPGVLASQVAGPIPARASLTAAASVTSATTSASADRSRVTTVIPSWASRSALARPMPLAPPVITAVRAMFFPSLAGLHDHVRIAASGARAAFADPPPDPGGRA